MRKKLYILALFAIAWSLPSCQYSKHLANGEVLLWKDKVYVNGKSGAPSEAKSILKQRPNSKLLGAEPSVEIYNWGNPENEKSFWRRVGKEPVVLDSAKILRGAEQLRNYYFNQGYFEAETGHQIEYKVGPRNWVSRFFLETLLGKEREVRARVTYYVITGPQYKINKFEQDIETPKLFGLSQFFKKDRLIQEGDYYNASILDQERDRLTLIYRNNGYYTFLKNYIRFEADTAIEGNLVNIKMIIDQKINQIGDSVYYTDHEAYRISDVYIRPDNDYLKSLPPRDTLDFLNYKITSDSLIYEPRYLTDAIHFNSGDQYNYRRERETYSHILGYQAFQSTEIDFKEAGRDSIGPLLKAEINLSPLKKRTFTIEPEVTTTSGNFGINGSIGWTNRNFLGSGEALEVRLNSGLEYQPSATSRVPVQTFEIGGEVSLSFPRFLLPFNTVGLLPKRMQPNSKVSASISRLTRSEFDRETFNITLTYNWQENSRKTHSISLLDVSYSRLFSVDSAGFLNQLDTIQRLAFTSELIYATNYTYQYNQQVDRRYPNPIFFRGSFEVAGNSLATLNEGNETPDRTVQEQIWDVNYFQYFKVELDFRHYWNFNKKNAWVNRVYASTIRPYGNSIISTDSGDVRLPPFSKFLSLGGSNDLRAWPIYRVGAGTSPNTDYDNNRDTTFATGTVKFLFNSEYRFPIYGSLRGAVFIDAGNIWLNGGLEDNQTEFQFDNFLSQLAIGTGVGFRLDLSYFIIRFDIGMKLRDPGLIGTGNEWVAFSQPNFIKNWTYNVALGYPF